MDNDKRNGHTPRHGEPAGTCTKHMELSDSSGGGDAGGGGAPATRRSNVVRAPTYRPLERVQQRHRGVHTRGQLRQIARHKHDATLAQHRRQQHDQRSRVESGQQWRQRNLPAHARTHSHTHGQQHEHRDIPQGGGYASEPSCGDNSFPALGPLQSGDKRLRATQRVQSAQRSQHTTWARAGNLHAVGCRQQLLSTHLVKDVSTSRW